MPTTGGLSYRAGNKAIRRAGSERASERTSARTRRTYVRPRPCVRSIVLGRCTTALGREGGKEESTLHSHRWVAGKRREGGREGGVTEPINSHERD